MTLLQTSLNPVHRKKERLFPLNKRNPPFTSVRHCSQRGWKGKQILLLEGMTAALPDPLALLQMHQACV